MPEDLPVIETKMREIIKSGQAFEYYARPREEAKKYFEERGEKYKAELACGLPDAQAGFYRNGGFTDLCKGPHVENTGEIKQFKLISIAGAYWRGSEKNPMLQRIYGIAFETEKDLNDHVKQQEEAAKRDHRKLGVELKLFSITEECGPGLALWHPKGAMVRKILEDWIREQNLSRGYYPVYTPHIARLHLWETSGHTSFYSDNMYSPLDIDGQKYQLKPMNCPFHILIYTSELRSYRDLPLRLYELGTVYRYERSGVMHGLLRARGFTQDDAHIFCTPEQINSEVESCFDFAEHIFKTFGFQKYEVELSTWDCGHPENYAGNAQDWISAQFALESVLKKRSIPFNIKNGEAAFYGPKIDIKLVDAINRLWQLSTIQFDFNLPSKFKLEYVAENGRKTPLMVHRALFGSIERFFGILIEHYAGLFPLWLAPVQVKILSINSAESAYAEKIAGLMRSAGIRVETDLRPEKINLKIREATLAKIPYIAVAGGKEASSGTVSLRIRGGKNLAGLEAESVIKNLLTEISEKRLAQIYQ